MIEAIGGDIEVEHQRKTVTSYAGDVHAIKIGADFTREGADFTFDTNS
jgi:hypothetical protein